MPEGRIICIRDVSSSIINVSGPILVRRFKEEKSLPTPQCIQGHCNKRNPASVCIRWVCRYKKKNSRKRVNVNELISLSLSLLFLIVVLLRVFVHPWFAPAICWRQMWSAILITHIIVHFCYLTNLQISVYFPIYIFS